MLRGFADVGATTFTADQSFDAVLGSATGKVFGGGVEVVLPVRVFANVRASRFREDRPARVSSSRASSSTSAFPTTITVTPVEVTGGYRFGFCDRVRPLRRRRRRLVPVQGNLAVRHRRGERGRPVHRIPHPRRRRDPAVRAGWRSPASCNGRPCPTPSATIRTACLTSSTNRILAGRPSASRSSSGCSRAEFAAIGEPRPAHFGSACWRRPTDSAGPRRHLRRRRGAGRQPARLAGRRQHHA